MKTLKYDINYYILGDNIIHSCVINKRNTTSLYGLFRMFENISPELHKKVSKKA